MKTNLFSKYKTDEIAEKEGNWFAVPELKVKFLVRRFGGSNLIKVKEANARFQKPFAKKMQAGMLSEEEQLNIGLKTFVSACLVNWEGIKDEEGNEVTFSFENAIEVLSPLEELTSTLIRYSSDYENYREDLGNS